MSPLSVIIITKNEERNIRDCMRSVSWANEFVVVDAGSSDSTVPIAKEFTEKIFVKEWLGYAEAKNFALENITNEWVLWLDADERLTPELGEEIRKVLHGDSPKHSAYQVARRAYFLGRWIKHCGWYPGYVTRLFRKTNAQFSSLRVHEHLEVQGTVGRLSHDLFHYTDDTLFHYFTKFNQYTSLAADDVIASGRNFSMYDVLVRPPYLFFKMYIFRLGFLDGMHGLILSLLSASYVYVKYVKIWERTVLRHP